ncbi:MAG: hypothetical protein ACYC91_07120 [Solirubrobacteraceae bacterium]
MQTLRRLNDPERYYGLSWRGWLGVALAGGALYGAVRISPLGVRPTITVAVLVLAFCGIALHTLSGQALGPARHLSALARHRFSPKLLVLPRNPEPGGLVLDADRQANQASGGDPLLAEEVLP